jgi:2-oxoglutarate dehydrogenase E2 component (dihydrolipoamide succinyltransferase)
MPTEIKMPQLGESVTEGTVGKWLKQPGERVEKYEALLEVTTDKVDTEVPSPAAGIVREIAVPEGTTVRVGTLLAVLDDGDDAAIGRQAERATGPENNGATEVAPHRPAAPPATSIYSGPISPIVARLAAEHNLDLGKINGTGQGGRVTKQDVLRYIETRDKPQPRGGLGSAPPADLISEPALPTAAASGPRVGALAEPPAATPPMAAAVAPAPAAEQELPEDAEIIPISPMRRAIAEHMVRSRRTAPHVTTVFEVDVSAIVAHRERRKADFERQGVKLTFTPYFVQAAVGALQAVPAVNGSYAETGIIMNARIHIGVAVALEEGLIVPVLRDADEKNLLGLARALNDLSERARSRRLKPDDTQGGTFTITNHGVSGSLFATPIINQPQAAILGVGAIQKRAVVISQGGVDAIAIRPMCYLSLTIDHRLLDGAMADRFLAVVKEFLEGYADG